MAWFRRTRRGRVNLGKFVAPEAVAPVPVDELLDEGELLSAASVRLAVKNRIILGSLRDDLAFDESRYAAAVGDELRALADERDAEADRIAADRTSARTRSGRADSFHDYRDADSSTLARREKYSRLLAERLRVLSDDEHYARTVSSQAQEAAWAEIAASVQARLTRAATIGDEPDYVIDRIDRLRDLGRDLRKLERERR